MTHASGSEKLNVFLNACAWMRPDLDVRNMWHFPPMCAFDAHMAGNAVSLQLTILVLYSTSSRILPPNGRILPHLCGTPSITYEARKGAVVYWLNLDVEGNVE